MAEQRPPRVYHEWATRVWVGVLGALVVVLLAFGDSNDATVGDYVAAAVGLLVAFAWFALVGFRPRVIVDDTAATVRGVIVTRRIGIGSIRRIELASIWLRRAPRLRGAGHPAGITFPLQLTALSLGPAGWQLAAVDDIVRTAAAQGHTITLDDRLAQRLA